MPVKSSAVAAVAALSLFITFNPCGADNGPLDPPAGPITNTTGPEPRREINALNTPGDADSMFKITAPGSYYLGSAFAFVPSVITGKSGIEIDADNVVIDLNGFSFTATSGSLHAVRINPGRQRVAVRNGSLSNWGRGAVTGEGSSSVHLEGLLIGSVGIGATGAPAITVNSGSIVRDVSINGVGSGGSAQPGVATSNNCIIERVAVTGATAGGIATGADCEIVNCTTWALTGSGVSAATGSSVRGTSARGCTGYGIQIGLDGNSFGGHVADCRAFGNGLGGIFVGQAGVVTHCDADGNAGNGIEAYYGSVISRCTSHDNTGDGFVTRDFGIISECQAYFNDQDGIDCAGGGGQVINCTTTSNATGIRASADTTVRNCTSDNNSGAGILALSSDAKIDGNTLTDNGVGIDVDAPGSIIIRNVCAGNGTNFDIVANNVVGMIVVAPLSGAILGSSGGAGVGSSDPCANFSY